MTTTLNQIATAVQTERPSKWYWDIKHFARTLEITVEEANGFISCIEKGGAGSKKDGTWRFNPKPFATKIDLTRDEENLLNFHYTDVKDKSSRLDNDRYIRLGRISLQNKAISVKIQRDIARFVMGTHKTLTQFYPCWANFRQENWRSWIDGGQSADHYQSVHLPYIAVHFSDVWDAPVARGTDPRGITPTVLNLVKNEIIEMMVCMYHLPATMLDRIALRRSRRNMAASDDVEIIPVQCK